MFMVDEPAAEAIRRAYEEGGELAGIVEFKRHFPLITDNAKARECARIIAGWSPVREQPAAEPKRRRKAAKPSGPGVRARADVVRVARAVGQVRRPRTYG